MTRRLFTALFVLLALPLVAAPETRSVAIVLYDGVEVLDFAGPAEVFEAAGHFGAAGGDHHKPAFKPYTVAVSSAPISSQRFIKIVPEYTMENAPQPDIIVIPGGNSGPLGDNVAFMAWLKRSAEKAELTLTVCTGSFVLAKSGLVDGMDITTWYDAVERLRTVAANSRVHAGRRFIDSGKFVTTAGVSAGIDGALHVVARLTGRHVADATARYMEYRWAPEAYLASGYSHLNPSLDDRGRAAQQAAIYSDEKNWVAAEQSYRALVQGDPNDLRSWYALGRVSLALKKFDQAIEASIKAAKAEDLKPRALYNAARAYAKTNNRDKAFEYLGQAIAAGQTNKNFIVNDPDLESLRADARFEKLTAALR